MAIQMSEREKEREYSLPVKIVISISYTQVIIPHAYFAFSSSSFFSFHLLYSFFIYSSTTRMCLAHMHIQTNDKHSTAQPEPIFTSKFRGSVARVDFFSGSHSSLLILSRWNLMSVCVFGVNSKHKLSHTITHVLHYYKV